MFNLYDLAYGLGLGLSSPLWLPSRHSRDKVLTALRQRMGKGYSRALLRPAVWIHAVSLGEMNATRSLIRSLQQKQPDLQYIVSTTTVTGFARAKELYGDDENVNLIRFPLDFSWAITRSLDALVPSIVVLMELEVWPNFLKACQQRNIPVLLANGRITEKSFRHYQWAKPIARSMFRRVDLLCAQDQLYADRFMSLGAPSDRVRVTGTMKFDTAQPGMKIPGVSDLAVAVGLRTEIERVWVAGSTGPGEEAVLLSVYRELLRQFTRLRLVLVPRHPERFDEVAGLIEAAKFQCVRRSRPPPFFVHHAIPPVVLGDTMGELRKFYALAELVFVGRTLVDLGSRQHGSDMIEPAALARPVIVGPFTHNFAEAMQKFRQAEAIREVADAASLSQTVAALLTQPADAKSMGLRAQQVVQREQGATERHVQAILQLLEGKRTLTTDNKKITEKKADE